MASQAFREQDEEAKAALAVQVPVPEEAEGDLLAGGGVGAAEWFGGLDPEDPGGVAQGYPSPRFPRPPAPVTPEAVYRGVGRAGGSRRRGHT